jgi:sugar lactone lactonase YvrE
LIWIIEADMKPEIIGNYRCHVGECPVWHPEKRRLYWVDIVKGQVICLNPESNTTEVCYEGEKVKGITLQEDGSLLLLMQKGPVARLIDGEVDYIIEQAPDTPGCVFNDVIADPSGRVIRGTACPEKPTEKLCGLYCVDTDRSVKLIADDIGFSNGLAFSPGADRLYCSDTFLRLIYVFDYNQQNGTLSNRRIFVETKPDEGTPDGLTVDSEGCLWVVLFGSGDVVRYTPDGIEERRIKFPSGQITSLNFGGEDLTDLYVTSAIYGPYGIDKSESAGALFKLKLPVKGASEFFSCITYQ